MVVWVNVGPGGGLSVGRGVLEGSTVGVSASATSGPKTLAASAVIAITVGRYSGGKAVGMGLSIPPDTFAVPLEQGTRTQEDWEYHSFSPEGEHMLSVAVNKSNKDEEPQYRVQEVLFAELLRQECKL